jgi:DNA polymerase-3 subunit delta'
MNLKPSNQLSLYGLDNFFREFIELYNKNKLPNKILLTGSKGIGKSTISYHIVNFVLSNNEDYSYDLINHKINDRNKSFKLIQNNTSPNFILIDVPLEKKMIDISQIRNMILNLNKSSFNSKPRFILIDNIEYLNLNSINALLKILEEPNDNTYFFLINNNKYILPTLKSRCLNFKISLSNEETIRISNKLINDNIYNHINENLIDYYSTPGQIYKLIKFSNENNIDLTKLDLKNFLNLIINENYYKKENPLKNIVYDLIELFLSTRTDLINSEISSNFLKRINDTKKFNLDEESLFIEFKSKILNV